MSKEKSLAERLEDFKKDYDPEETKKITEEMKAHSEGLDKMVVTNQSNNDNVQKMGHTHEKHCDIL